MAVPADVHEQLVQVEARLHLVPAGETPPAKAVLEQVERWQEHVREVAETIRWADGALEALAHPPEGLLEQDLAERNRVSESVRNTRRRAFALMQRLNPDQAWFWTEEWQAGEREVDRAIAAGKHGTFYASTEEFAVALEARLDDDEHGSSAVAPDADA